MNSVDKNFSGPVDAIGTPSSISTYAILSLITAFFIPVLPVIFGHIALREIQRSSGTKTGKGLAIAGLILGYLAIVAMVLGFSLVSVHTSSPIVTKVG
jgi:hypothetical protein